MTTPASVEALRALIRTVPDFPKPGIAFRDITPLIADGNGLRSAVQLLAQRASAAKPDMIAGMEARGFIFGAAVAAELGVGFLPVRKPGKLPVQTMGVDYTLEYGSDRLEIDPTLFAPGARIAIIDDLIATGGTAVAAASLLRKAGASAHYAGFVIDLPDLGGADRLRDCGLDVEALLSFEGE